MSQSLEETFLEMLSQAKDGESISPNDVAKAIDPINWRRELPKVRSMAIGMARQGRIEVLRKGKPVDPDGFKGLYRLKLSRP